MIVIYTKYLDPLVFNFLFNQKIKALTFVHETTAYSHYLSLFYTSDISTKVEENENKVR